MRLSTTVWAGPPGLGGASSTSRVQYCRHIRWHVVFKRLHLGQGHAVVTEALGVPKDTQTNIIERFLETGDVQTWQGRREAPPANKVLGCDADLRLLGNVIDDPAATLNERCSWFELETGIKVHLSSICRALHRLDFSYQKARSLSSQTLAHEAPDALEEARVRAARIPPPHSSHRVRPRRCKRGRRSATNSAPRPSGAS